MAEIKKYLDQAATQTLVEQVKAKDAATLQAAKDYTDSKASNYEAAGSVATAKEELNQAIAGVQGEVDAVEQALATEEARAKAAEEANAAAAKQAQDEVDALELYVGTIPTGATATDVIGYVQERTSGIATESALAELQAGLAQAQEDIGALEADHLVKADKEALQTSINEVAGSVETLSQTHATDKKALEDADVALQTAVGEAAAAAGAAQTHSEGVAEDLAEAVEALEGADSAQVERIAALEGQIVGLSGAMHFEGVKDAIPSGEALAEYENGDVIIVGNKEYVMNNGAFVEFGDVSAQAEAITELTGRMDSAEADIDKVEAAVATKAEAQALTDAIGVLEDADEGLDERLKAIEDKFKDGEGSVEDQIADAKQGAIDTAAADATEKANQALTDAKAYTDEKDTAMSARVEALEAVDHEHANKALLDTYTQTEENLADAVAKKHAHENKEVLDGITAEKVSAWDASEKNAKDYADGLNTAMTSKVDGIDGRVTANAEAIALKASQVDFIALTERVTTAETGIATNASAIAAFQPITSGEIEAMFA